MAELLQDCIARRMKDVHECLERHPRFCYHDVAEHVVAFLQCKFSERQAERLWFGEGIAGRWLGFEGAEHAQRFIWEEIAAPSLIGNGWDALRFE